MMLAAKHFDVVLGVDVHIVLVPTPGGPVPTPIPHPFVGMVYDVMDWIPITIMIPASVANVMGKAFGAVDSAVKAVTGQSSGQGEGGSGSGNIVTRAAMASGGEGGGEEPPEGGGAVPMALNATVWVNGLPRGQAGTNGKGAAHIPIGGPAFQKTSIAFTDSKCELLMGSKTVLADGSPFTYLGLPTLSCTCIGAPPPPHAPDEPEAGFFLPVSVVLPIPAGTSVFVGGPPTVNWMALAFKLPGALKKLAKGSKTMKKVSEKMNKIADKIFGEAGRLRNAIRAAICFITGHPVDVATGKVFTEIVDFELPGPIPLEWERVWFSTSVVESALGHGWHHKYDMAFGFDEKEQVTALRMADGRCIGAPFLEKGEKYFNRQERLEFFRDEKGYGVLDCGERLVFRFTEKQMGKFHPLARIENLSGQAILFEHTPSGHLSGIVDSAGRTLKVNTDSKGRITSILAPHPERPAETFNIVSYEYDERNNLTVARDALSQPFRYFYEKHLLVKETNRNGLSFYFKYDGDDHNARCIHTWGDGGIYSHKLTYNLEEKFTVVENSLGHKATHFWNDMGLVFRTVDPLGNVSSKNYSPDTNILSETDELGQTTSYAYDEFSNQTAINFPDGSAVELQYENHLLIAAADQNGGKWQWQHDDAGQLIQRTDPMGRKTRYNYLNGQLSQLIDPAGGITRLQYDAQKNLTALTTPDGAASHWEYDSLGRCTKATDPKGNAQERLFNLLDWVQRVHEPDGDIRHLEYDAEGNVTRARDKHHDIRFEYEGMNRLKSRTAAGTHVEFTYNTEEDLTGIVNEHGYAYRFELNACGDVAAESGFDGVVRRYLRDAAGRVSEVKRPGGLSTRYEYDMLGQVIQVNHSDGTNEKYLYRPDGELLEATNQHIAVKFERDPLGQIIKEIQGGFVIDSVYDTLGMRTEVRSSLGAHLQFGRNLMGDVESVSANGTGKPWEATFKRDSLGLETERLLPGGVRSRWERDKLGRPVKQETFAGGNKPARTRSYTWDVNDRLKQIVDSQKGITKFEHDVFGNLASAQYGDGSFEFRMPDAVGNLFRSKDQKDRKYGPAGQLLEAKGTRYEYDAEGNLIQKTEPDGSTWHYEWNAAGMLRRVVRPDGDTVTFTYDALGRRISKQYRGKTTRWVWDGNNILHEWAEVAPPSPKEEQRPAATAQAGGTIKIKRRDEQLATAPTHAPPSFEFASQPETSEQSAIRNPQSAITTWVFEPESFAPLAKLSDGAQYSIVTDHLGTPVSMFSERGEKVWDMDLSIYGEVRNLQGWREACPFRYPGQYEDVETGLYYNRFRYYDAEGGFYVSQDPIGLFGGMKPHSYVRDINKWTDVFGLTNQAGCVKTKGKKRGPKTKDQGGPHNDMIGKKAKELEDDGWTIIEGGNKQKEKLHRIPGGKKDRRPDIVAEKGGKTKVVNVGKKKADGNPVKREAEAKKDLEKLFDDVEFIPYN